MRRYSGLMAVLAAVFGSSGPALAQDQPVAAFASGPVCELHVWPTQNYIGINSGLLSGFGIIGAVADMDAHKNRVRTVKDLMRDYLGPEVQMAELNRIGLLQSLGLPANYTVIVEEPTPWNEDLKTDPALKARVKVMNATLKAGRRLTSSQSPCYAELITTMVFYHKAMMYGSNLFTGWVYRDFGDKPVAVNTGAGAVKNPLEVFPPKTAEAVPAAQAELREAFVKDYREWLAKKKAGTGAAKR